MRERDERSARAREARRGPRSGKKESMKKAAVVGRGLEVERRQGSVAQ